MTRTRFFGCALLLMSLLLTGTGRAAPGAPNAAKWAALRPNVDLSLYRRSFTPDEPVLLRVSGFNVKQVRFAVYPLSLPTLVPNSKALGALGKPIAALNLARQAPVKAWTFVFAKTYPDQWAEGQVKAPPLPRGVYVIVARAGTAEKRTWFAVSDTALVAKRSRQMLLLYAAGAKSGAPIANLALTLTDARGQRVPGQMDTHGMLRVSTQTMQGSVWAYGAGAHGPAFVLSGAPPAPDPFVVYAFTDRPLYRPGQTVQFKATLRRRQPASAPAGFAYQTYANQKATIEVRDATDALIEERTVTTNAFGSVGGSLLLSDAPTLGRWQLIIKTGEQRSYASFAVQEYRKPEYTVGVQTPAAHILGGAVVPITIEARYLFGQAVAGASVKYSLDFEAEDGGKAEPSFTGQGVTNAQGRLVLQVPTQHLRMSRTLQISATVTDLSRRAEHADNSVLLTAGAFRLSVATDKDEYRAGERISVTVHAADYDDKPIQTSVKTTLIETKYDRKHRPYEERTVRTIATNAKGNGDLSFTPLRPGEYALEALAFDASDNPIQATESITVVGKDAQDNEEASVSLTPNSPMYHPGETALVTLHTSLIGTKSAAKDTFPTAYALVTLEGERLYQASVLEVTARDTVLRVPLTALQFPSASLHATIVQDKHLYEQEINLPVAQDAQKLRVVLTPDSARHRPGENAAYTVTTQDSRGRAVPAEVGLGIVDSGIYALAPDNAPSPSDVFWPDQEVRVQTDFSFAAMYSGGAFQTMPRPAAIVAALPPPKPKVVPEHFSAGQRQTSAIRVRSRFADTAYWNAFVDTDAQGTARIAFPLPDNLTTWRATARGITQATQVGQSTHEMLATLPLLVRLELPRFAVQGDTALVSAIVHNDTGQVRTVQVHLEAAGASLTGAAQRTLLMAPGAQQRVEWQAHVVPSPAAPADAVRFLVTANGGEANAQDAAALFLPTLPDGLKQVRAQSDVLAGLHETQTIALADLPLGASVTLTLTPSIGSSLFGALDELQSYPYGCAEQTTSAFLPDVIVQGTLARLHVARAVRPQLAQWVSVGLQKLYRYQHADGGWNWWEFDQTDEEMTAYVLSGLVAARDAGYVVDAPRINRGAQALTRLLQGERDPSKRADALLVLASITPADVRQPLLALYARRSELDTYGLASLVLALSQTGQQAEAAAAARELAAKARVQGTSAYWPANEGGYTWRDDDTSVTAHALRALLSAEPQSLLAPAVVRRLMGTRDGPAWASTKSTSEAVLALAQYLQATNELHPRFQASVTLDGASVARLDGTESAAFAPPMVVTLAANQLAGHKTLTLAKDGTGTLYATRTVRSLAPPAQAVSAAQGIAVERTFQVPASNPIAAGTVPSGQEIDVSVDLTADADYRYALLEEPIPAGCEVMPEGDTDDDSLRGGIRREVHDNRLVFFFDTLPQGRTHLTYRLRTETPGTFRILPSIASLAYFPEVRGNSGLATVQVGATP